MRILSLFFIVCFSFLLADNSAQQLVTFSVSATNQIGPIEGAAPVFSLDGKLGQCAECKNMYTIFTNEENKKVVAYLDQDMPAGVILCVSLSPPKNGRSTGKQKLSSVPADLLVEVSKVSEAQLELSYEMMITEESGVIKQGTRTVTFVMTDG